MNLDEPNVDPALLGQARQILGTTDTRGTLELALSMAIRQASRDHAIAAERARFEAGRYASLPACRGRGEVPARRPGSPPGDPAGLIPAPPAGCLIDTSALSVAGQPGVAAALHALLQAGAAVTCPLLDLEVLDVAQSADDYAAVASIRRLAYRSVPITPPIGRRMISLHELLSRRAHRCAATPADVLVAATAMEYELRVVHSSPALALLGELAGLDQVAVRSAGEL